MSDLDTSVPTAAPLALVLGLGDSGLAMARHLARSGHPLRVADTRAAPPQAAALATDLPQAECVTGPFDDALLDGVGLVALSPGLSPTHAPAHALLAAAAARGIEVVGEIELFARALVRLAAERGYVPQVVGISGTNGKTTTTALLGHMLARSGRAVAVAGNIGPTALDTLAERLAAGTLPQVWVLELSSFQLATVQSLACDAATVLNVTQDHLDWHGTMDAYAAAKARIFAARTVQVLNRDDARVLAMARKGTRVLRFGVEAPALGDDWGLVRDGGLVWLAWAEDLGVPGKRRKNDTTPPDLFLHRLMPADALQLRGRHNAANALAALALARAIGCPLAPLLHALAEYRGEPHRVERVATLNGVDFYDDSKGTNVGATVAALDGLGAEGRRLHVILGGDGKGQDFAPLAAAVARHAARALLIGRDAGAIEAALIAGAPAVPRVHCATLADAVRAAAADAGPSTAVLLSPACASLDMFRDYRHRAEVFVDTVRELAAEAGQPC